VVLRDSVTRVPFQFEVVGATVIVAVVPKPVLSVGKTVDSDSWVVPVIENELGHTVIGRTGSHGMKVQIPPVPHTLRPLRCVGAVTIPM